MKNKIHEVAFTIKDGKRVLQCHSRGDFRFSPFFCYIDSFGLNESIENHYQQTKVFSKDGDFIKAKDWKEAKRMQKSNLYLNRGFFLPNGIYLGEENSSAEDLVIQYYIGLWYKFLSKNQYLIDIAKEFDDFEDPFEGKFPFGQAKVFQKVSREGLDSLYPMFQELNNLINKFYGL